MRWSRDDITAGLVILAGLVVAGPANAGDGPEAKLRKLGLERAGLLCTLEREADVQRKFGETQGLFKEYANAYMKTLDIQFAAARAKAMDDWIIELDHDIDTLNVELGYRPGRPNNVQRDYFDALRFNRDDLALKRTEARTEARRLRNLPIGERARQEAKAEFDRSRQACRPAVEELRTRVESTDAKYAELAKNREVLDSISALGRVTSSKLKLGPSPQYRNAARQLGQFEKYLDHPASMLMPKPALRKKRR